MSTCTFFNLQTHNWVDDTCFQTDKYCVKQKENRTLLLSPLTPEIKWAPQGFICLSKHNRENNYPHLSYQESYMSFLYLCKSRTATFRHLYLRLWHKKGEMFAKQTKSCTPLGCRAFTLYHSPPKLSWMCFRCVEALSLTSLQHPVLHSHTWTRKGTQNPATGCEQPPLPACCAGTAAVTGGCRTDKNL